TRMRAIDFKSKGFCPCAADETNKDDKVARCATLGLAQSSPETPGKVSRAKLLDFTPRGREKLRARNFSGRRSANEVSGPVASKGFCMTKTFLAPHPVGWVSRAARPPVPGGKGARLYVFRKRYLNGTVAARARRRSPRRTCLRWAGRAVFATRGGVSP